MIQGTRNKWGLARFGTRRVSAMAFAIPGGLVLGAAAGLLAVLAGITGSNAVLGFLVFASCLTMPAVALVYGLIVDRNTLEGAAVRPEESVESGWYERAASGSFTDLILVLGLGATILTFLPMQFAVELKLILPGVLVICFVSFAVRYLMLRRQG